MEGPPRKEQSAPNEDLSFEDKLLLANTLFSLVTKRNAFLKRQGGFDNFAEITQHLGNNRQGYDELEAQVQRARATFDADVKDKQGFVAQLRVRGMGEIATVIAGMFRIKETRGFSRFFKR